MTLSRKRLLAGRYVLKDKVPVLEPDLLKWARAFEDFKARRVDRTEFPNGTYVSTVFLGLDHQFLDGPPLLFETMIFNDDSGRESYCDRCSTWDEAVEMHKRAVYMVGDRYVASQSAQK